MIYTDFYSDLYINSYFNYTLLFPYKTHAKYIFAITDYTAIIKLHESNKIVYIFWKIMCHNNHNSSMLDNTTLVTSLTCIRSNNV